MEPYLRTHRYCTILFPCANCCVPLYCKCASTYKLKSSVRAQEPADDGALTVKTCGRAQRCTMEGRNVAQVNCQKLVSRAQSFVRKRYFFTQTLIAAATVYAYSIVDMCRYHYDRVCAKDCGVCSLLGVADRCPVEITLDENVAAQMCSGHLQELVRAALPKPFPHCVACV
jgi:hypothetical protein